MARYRTEDEMQLLKEFAIAALPAIIQCEGNIRRPGDIAELAYEYAEAMLEQDQKVANTPQVKSAA